MSNAQVVEIHQRSDAQCWYDAIQLHNAGLKKGTADKYYIHPQATGSADDRELNAKDLLGTVLATYQKSSEKSGPLATCLMQIVATVHRHASAIDSFVQSNPAIASLVWGSARILLQINEDHQRASLLVSEGILLILRHVARWEQISNMADLLNSPVIREAVALLYVKVLDFLVFSTHWMRKSSIQRFGSSILTSKAGEVEGKQKLLTSASEDLDKELQTKATRFNIESLSEISLGIKDLQSTKNQIDIMLQEVQHLSGPVIHSKLNDILQGQKVNNMSVMKMLSELRLLPVLVTNTCLSQMQDNIDFTETKKWLSLANLESPCSARETDGTCQWILNDPLLQEWKDNPEENTLWIQGFEGTGKSVMANFLQMRLEDEGYHTILYQFQQTGSLQSSTPTTFASSVALQILSINSQFPLVDDFIKPIRQLQVLSARHPLGPQTCPFDTLWSISMSLLTASGVSFRILIDAVDECRFKESSQPSWPAFAKNMSQLLQTTKSKVLLFSRPDALFTSEVQSSQAIRMDEKVLLPDISRLAKDLCEEFEIPHSRREDAVDWVCRHSQGSFRWTWLILNDLGRSMKPSDFDLRLRILPPSVSDLYRKAMEEFEDLLYDDERELQNCIIVMVYGAQRVLRTTELSSALQLRADQAERIIHRLCKPFISSQDGILRFTHLSAREFFGAPSKPRRSLLKIPASDADTILAQKCLDTLLSEEYSSLDRIANLLKINYPDSQGQSEQTPEQPEFYDYASQYWDYHLSRSRVDCHDLRRQLVNFLEAPQFAHWAEYSSSKFGQHVCTLRAFERLGKWASGLSKKTKIRSSVDEYFEKPYNDLIVSFQSGDEYRTVQWLARMSLGNYFFTAGAETKTTQVRAEVLNGLKELLGPDSILTLRASTDYAYTRFYSGNMRAARGIYNKVLETQKRLLGEENALTLETLIYSGQSKYYMAEFAEALTTFATAMTGFLNLAGPDSWQYLGVQMWYARCLAQLGQFDAALETLEFVSQKRREQYGTDDPFDSVVRVAIGEILRLLDRQDESISTLKEVLELQHDENPTTRKFKLDISIALGISLFAAGRIEEALAVIERLEGNQILGESNLFDRVCQIAHIKALIFESQDRADEAIQLLQETLIQTEPDQGNRSLLWIRLDVAAMLRRRNDEGDSDEARAVFDHVVKDMSGNEEPGFPDEPDQLRLLIIAERALQLVRARKFNDARSMLKTEEVAWSRSSDFWLRVSDSAFCS